jgi:hypothetical protein
MKSKSKWILVAEDDRNDADLTLRALTAAKQESECEVVVARDGSEALDRLFRPAPSRAGPGSGPEFRSRRREAPGAPRRPLAWRVAGGAGRWAP